MVAASLCFLLLAAGPSDRIDRRISDRLLVQERLQGRPDFLIVEIDSKDLIVWGGGPPISRSGIAQLAEALRNQGVSRVLFDQNFAVPIDPKSDLQLEQAFARLGPQRLGLVSAVTTGDLPLPDFARHATILDARLTPDEDGWHRRMGIAAAPNGNNPAIWLAQGQQVAAPIHLDLRVKPGTFERTTARDVLAGRAPVAGRKVIVTISPEIVPSRAVLPYSRRADRAAVIAMGAHAVATGYEAQRESGSRYAIAVVGLSMILGFAIAIGAASGKSLIGMLLGGGALLIAGSLVVGQAFAVEIFPLRAVGCFLLIANVTLAQRLKLVPMVGSFLRGDISPEEAWAWRSCEASDFPVLLLSAEGAVKRNNAAGAELAEQHGPAIARLCLLQPGGRAERIELLLAHRNVRSFEVDWPYPHVPIVMLRDVTHAEAAQRILQQQLLTDELTGQANRRGFDHALQRAASTGEPYRVFFLDMNGFKAINDTYGHDAGDELLTISAARLAGLVRHHDTVARLGGDEFAIIMAGQIAEDRAEDLARQMVDAIAQPIDLIAGGVSVQVAAAVGHAQAATGEDPAAVLRRADKEMYRDKLRSKLAVAA